MRNSGSRLCAYGLLWVSPEWRSGLAGHLTLSDEDLTSVTQNHWKRLNTLQHYKVLVGGNRTRWMGQGLPLGSICDLIPRLQVPDGATVVLIPQVHNGGTVSQSLGQTGCPSGESKSLVQTFPSARSPSTVWGSPGLDSLEPQAGSAKVLATLSVLSRFHTPPCQWDSQISRLNQDVEILETWGVRLSKFLSHLSLVPYLLPLCSLLTSSQEKCGLCIVGFILRAGAQDRDQASVPLDTPMLEDGEEGGVRLWHLVKATEEAEGAKVRRSSLRDRERERSRAKAIPEIYLTRLLSMKVGLTKVVRQRIRVVKEL
jgi:hypothetical protein